MGDLKLEDNLNKELGEGEERRLPIVKGHSAAIF